jgi:hypothetical protein
MCTNCESGIISPTIANSSFTYISRVRYEATSSPLAILVLWILSLRVIFFFSYKFFSASHISLVVNFSTNYGIRWCLTPSKIILCTLSSFTSWMSRKMGSDKGTIIMVLINAHNFFSLRIVVIVSFHYRWLDIPSNLSSNLRLEVILFQLIKTLSFPSSSKKKPLQITTIQVLNSVH